MDSRAKPSRLKRYNPSSINKGRFKPLLLLRAVPVLTSFFQADIVGMYSRRWVWIHGGETSDLVAIVDVFVKKKSYLTSRGKRVFFPNFDAADFLHPTGRVNFLPCFESITGNVLYQRSTDGEPFYGDPSDPVKKLFT